MKRILSRFFLRSSALLVMMTLSLSSCASTKPEPKLDVNYPVISFDRSGCFGACPAYTLTFRGDGSATYIGKSNVERVGHWRASIDDQSLRFLMRAFDQIRFYQLNDMYDAMVTDIPTLTLRYSLHDSSKTVVDRFGPPAGLKDLERSIDSVGETLKWYKVAAE